MKRPFLALKQDCDEAVRWITDHLNQSGLQVVQTFDLQTARTDHSLCSCPHHGTERCDCQMVVLLVYENGFPPASVVAHGHDGQTWFTLVNYPQLVVSPQQGIRLGLEAAIQEALALHITAPSLDDLANVS